jgi:branched-chain amino acid transport system substrate-binding protein
MMFRSFKKNICILLAISFCWACAPKPPIPPVSPKFDRGDILFSEAEKLFQEKSYDKALESYETYLSRFPDTPLAAAALLKIGAIYAALGKNMESRNAYQRLIDEYPDSSFVPDAEVEILVTLYNEGKYREVIDQANGVLEARVSQFYLLKTNILLGDAYLALDSPADAFYFYAAAYNLADHLQKESITIKIKQALEQMKSAEMISLLGRLEDNEPKGYLMYQLGLNDAREEKYDNALRMFSAFVAKFPDHENAGRARGFIEDLSKKTVYDPSTIGCMLPLSGPYKAYGNRALRGIEFALSQHNSRHVHHPLKIIIKDTESDPSKAEQAIEELYRENVAAIIGPIITAEAAARASQAKGIPIITLTQKDNITDIGDHVFRNFLTPIMQVKTIVSYAIEELGIKRFAILYPNENYGITFMNLLWDEIIACGGKVVGLESYSLTQTDFADPIKKLAGCYYEMPEDLKESGQRFAEEENADDDRDRNRGKRGDEDSKVIVDFDAVIIPDAPKKAGLIIPQLAYYDIENIYLFGTNLWHSDSLIKMAKEYLQGAMMTDGFFAESPSDEVRNFVDGFEEIFGEKPGFIEAVSYDTAMMVFQKVACPDICFRSALRDELAQLHSFQGVTGLTSFDVNREAVKKLYLLCVKGRRFVELEHK